LNMKNVIRVVLVMMIILFIGEYLPIFSVVIVGIPISLLIYSDKHKLSAIVTQIVLTISILISLTFTIYIITTVNGVSILEIFELSLKESEAILTSNDLLLGNEVDINQVVNQILSIIPFMVILLSSINAMLMYFVNRHILIKMNFKVREVKKISAFRLPMHFVYGVTFILFLSYIVGAIDIVNFDSISLNVILIMIYVFAFQGVAVLFYFLDKKNIAKIVKIILIFMLMLFQGIFILSIVGWMDMIFNFRKIKKSE